jgi:hypothetical protein
VLSCHGKGISQRQVYRSYIYEKLKNSLSWVLFPYEIYGLGWSSRTSNGSLRNRNWLVLYKNKMGPLMLDINFLSKSKVIFFTRFFAL